MRPTLCPSAARPTDRFTDTVVLPTPPFPEPTAIRFFTPAMGSLGGGLGDIASIVAACGGRHVGAVDSGLNDTDLVSERGQAHRQVLRYGGLADAALPGTDGDQILHACNGQLGRWVG